eukprot:scaffold30112_cov24-Tisochrysis_lutea.AAC.1
MLAAAAYTDATWDNQLHGQWRSAQARELDRLGGAEREAVGRGQRYLKRNSMKLATLAHALLLPSVPTYNLATAAKRICVCTANSSSCIHVLFLIATSVDAWCRHEVQDEVARVLAGVAKSGLAEQGLAIQDALAKDPNAGRHEIQRQ